MIRTVGTAHSDLPQHPPVQPSPFSAALGPVPPARAPAAVIGLEQEYAVRRAGAGVDFRNHIHELAVPGIRLDPGDANAYRCPSGLVLTCDGDDAEVVSPPVDVRPGFGAEIRRWSEHGWAQLVRILPGDMSVEPFSTHLSASVPDDVVVAAGDRFARTFAPALMLMLDGAGSHGVFVRPRPGRLELCGEHAAGPRLGAAAVLVAGGARASVAAGRDQSRLPPVLSIDLRPATGRPGLFVGRHLAFGADLYAAGRRAVLPLEASGTITAEDQLEAAWRAAKPRSPATPAPTTSRTVTPWCRGRWPSASRRRPLRKRCRRPGRRR